MFVKVRFAALILSLGPILFESSQLATAVAADAWQRHTIDDQSRGADGVRLADMNGDGRLDIATGWEEGGITRVYVHPGAALVRQPWPAVTVGNTSHVEDAVWVDLDRDGVLDVVSSCEGTTRQLFIHWAPTDMARWQEEDRWLTQAFPALAAEQQMWMFAVALQVDGRHGVDLVLGSKGPRASVGWLEAPENPRDVAAWHYHRWIDAGWIMSLLTLDVDGDRDLDILLSDRKGSHTGVRWLENPGTGTSIRDRWAVHEVGGRGREPMFLDVGRLDAKHPFDIVVADRRGGLIWFWQDPQAAAIKWRSQEIARPAGCGTPKAVALGDMDLDGQEDIVFSCEAARNQSGVRWLSRDTSALGRWRDHEISGTAGTKFDRLELVDLDEDGDLDVLTCEETENLGVIWYENPAKVVAESTNKPADHAD